MPAFVAVFILSAIPIGQAVYTAFTDQQAGRYFHPSFIGMQNFKRLLHNSLYWNSFRIGIIWAVSVTLLAMVLGFGLALLLNRELRFRALLRTLSLVPWAMPPVVIAIMWSILLNPQGGPFNGILRSFHLPYADRNWLGDFNTALPTVIVIGAWASMPIITVSLLAALQSVPLETVEAARIDGANSWQRFRYVTLPAVKSITSALVSLNIIWQFSSFGLIYVLTAGGPGGKTFVPALFVYDESFKYGNFGYAASMGVVMALAILGMLGIYLKVSNRKEA